MNCKFCNAQMEDDVTICPACGKSQDEEVLEEVSCCTEEVPAEETVVEETAAEEVSAEEPAAPKVKMSTGKLLLIAVCGILLLGILAVAILRGSGAEIGPQGEGVLYKSNYTVSEKDAVRKQDKVVARIDGAKLTNGELQAHYFGNIYQFLDSYGTSYFDYNSPLSEQYFDAAGMTWQQYLLDTTLYNWQRYQVLAYLAQQEGFVADLTSIEELRTELEEGAVEYGFSSADEMIHEDMGDSCSLEDYLNYVTLMRIGNQFVEYISGSVVGTQEDLEAYYAAAEADFIEAGLDKNSGNIVSVRHLLIMPKGEQVDKEYTEDQWAEALAEAERIYGLWKAGEATEDSFSALVTEYTEDTASAADGGLYPDITPYSSYVPEFLEWSVDPERQVGDTGIVKTTYGYHIMYYVEGEPLWIRAARDNYPSYYLSVLVNETLEQTPVEIYYKDIVVTDANVTE